MPDMGESEYNMSKLGAMQTVLLFTTNIFAQNMILSNFISFPFKLRIWKNFCMFFSISLILLAETIIFLTATKNS